METINLKSAVQGNEVRIRLVAFFVLLTVIVHWRTGSVLPLILLTGDFLLRSFDLGRYSPFAILAGRLVKIFSLPFRPVYLPPKRFAARMGLVMSLLITTLHVAALDTLLIGLIFAVFASLESFFGFCAGCRVYDLIHRFKTT